MADSNKESLFTFDPTDFVKGIKMMSQAMNQMSSQAESNAKSLEGATNKGFGEMAKGQDKMVKQQKQVGKSFFKALVAFEIFKKVVGAGFGFLKGIVGEFLPEVGQVFSVVKNIMFKNLFFPLRKFILPMLNRILAWVTRSRGLFVKWGAVIVNVFKVVITIFKAFWSLAKAVIKGFTSTFSGMFKGMGKDLTEVVNLMMFKVTVAVITLQQILKPVAKFIGKMFGFIVDSIVKFTKGFVKGFSNVFKITEGLDQLKKIGTALNELFGELGITMENTGGFFTSFGEILGHLVGTTLKSALVIIEKLIKSTTALIKLFKGDASDMTWGFDVDIMKKQEQERLRKGQKRNPWTGEIITPDKKVNDALITKGGKVIEFNPNDNILATQGGVGGAGNMVTINMPVTVSSTEGDAFATGQGVGEGIMSKLRDSLVGEIVLSGA